MTKSPNNIDRHVGGRLRMRRLLVGMSQERLGDSLGVTFQQVQKYEKGTNRIGASRLQQIAEILNVPPAFFFEGSPVSMPSPGPGFAEEEPSLITEFLSTADGQQLAKAFLAIRDPKVRRKVIDLVTVLADTSADEPESLEDTESDALPQQSE